MLFPCEFLVLQFVMAATCSQILSEARALVTKLHDREKSCSSMIGQTQQLSERIRSMAEYKEDLEALNNLNPKPRSALVHSLQQENRQIRLLQEENRQLKLALEEHQAALELIMRKYRQQMLKAGNLHALQLAAQRALDQIKIGQSRSDLDIERELEMSGKFDACLRLGEDASHIDHATIAQLQAENKVLRQLVNIASTNDPQASCVYNKMMNDFQLGASHSDIKAEEQTTPKADLSPSDSPCNSSPNSTFAQASATVAPSKKSVSKVKVNGNNNTIGDTSTIKRNAVKRTDSKENNAKTKKKEPLGKDNKEKQSTPTSSKINNRTSKVNGVKS